MKRYSVLVFWYLYSLALLVFLEVKFPWWFWLWPVIAYSLGWVLGSIISVAMIIYYKLLR